MTTIERYKLNPSKSAVSLEYEPYSHSDYLTLMSKYQNMRLPKGLGPTDDERWQKEVFVVYKDLPTIADPSFSYCSMLNDTE